MKFVNLFGRLRSVVIGVIHVKALPGTPLSNMKMSQITEEACTEANIYLDAGVVSRFTILSFSNEEK